MKKVFWGILLAMANLGGIISAVITFTGSLPYSILIEAAVQLSTAVGYLLIMLGARDLAGGNFGYASKLSKVLCAFTTAVLVLGLLNIMPGGTIAGILFWVADLGSFITMYFCVLGVGDLERSSGTYLYWDKLQKSFSAWVILNILSSFIPYLMLPAIAVYIFILFYYWRAARNYKGGGSWRVY